MAVELSLQEGGHTVVASLQIDTQGAVIGHCRVWHVHWIVCGEVAFIPAVLFGGSDGGAHPPYAHEDVCVCCFLLGPMWLSLLCFNLLCFKCEACPARCKPQANNKTKHAAPPYALHVWKRRQYPAALQQHPTAHCCAQPQTWLLWHSTRRAVQTAGPRLHYAAFSLAVLPALLLPCPAPPVLLLLALLRSACCFAVPASAGVVTACC